MLRPRRAVAQNLRDLGAQRAGAFRKDHLVRGAEVVQVAEAPLRPVPELGAAAVANRLELTHLAIRVRDRLFGCETVPPRAASDLAPGVEIDVPQLPSALHEEVAGEDIAVILDHDVAVAGFVHLAAAGFLAGKRLGDVVEEPDAHPAVLRPPDVEQVRPGIARTVRP